LRPTTVPRSGIAQDATQRGGTHERSDCRCWPGGCWCSAPRPTAWRPRTAWAGRHARLAESCGQDLGRPFSRWPGHRAHQGAGRGRAVRAWTNVTAWELGAALGEMGVVGAQIGELLRQPRQYQLQRLLTALHLLGVRAGPPFRHFASRGGARALTGRGFLVLFAPTLFGQHRSVCGTSHYLRRPPPLPPPLKPPPLKLAPLKPPPPMPIRCPPPPRKARCAPGLGP
jgi:hypothetical protein